MPFLCRLCFHRHYAGCLLRVFAIHHVDGGHDASHVHREARHVVQIVGVDVEADVLHHVLRIKRNLGRDVARLHLDASQSRAIDMLHLRQQRRST